ncbi:MAG: sugar transferase [Clostridia bacterium]|nr:sugar transferase [Clostridia bacterium]
MTTKAPVDVGLQSPKKNRELKNVMDFAQVMLSYHSNENVAHFQHVKRYTRLLCYKYNDLFPEKAMPRLTMEFICEGAGLHDIGKISVPDSLLQKKAPLSTKEYEEIKQHTVAGAQIIDRMAEIYKLGDEAHLLRNICLYHHERYDGSGYPDGLKGDEIPIEAQFVSVTEVYDALIEDNYKDAISHDEAIEKIISGECGAFNPDIILCLKLIENDLKLLRQVGTLDRMDLLEQVYSKNRRSYWKVKRGMDVSISFVALVVLSPLMGLIAAAIYLDDPKGSPIFKQTRLGRHKKPFTMYKFRTMVVDAEARKKELEKLNQKDGPAFKIANDPRITRVGRILRKTSLDELPQLVNILKGDMAIVGPRPPLPDEVQQYSRYHEIRLSVTPGLTCEWQSQPKRDEIGFDTWVDMDVSYIGTRSIWRDIRIILKTVLAVLSRSGS